MFLNRPEVAILGLTVWMTVPVPGLAAPPTEPAAVTAAEASQPTPSGVITQLDLRAAAGYDSNVFRLNDDRVGEEGGMFTDLEAELSVETGRRWTLSADLGASARLYESSVDDGNESQYRLRVRGERIPATRPGTVFKWALSHTLRDATYVSRSTGRVATSGGVDIGDRYDSGKTELEAKLDLPFTAQLHGLLGASVASKDYRRDYESLGLDRLDYLAYGVEPGLAYRSKTQELRLTLPASLRRYRDRRASDVAGNEVAGSDLEYRYIGVDARYEYELSRVHTLLASASYEERADNEDGFADSNTTEISLGWAARPQRRTRYARRALWSARQYDRLTAEAQERGEEAPEREGYSLVGEFSSVMPGLQKQDVRLIAEARLDSYDNDSDPVFSYDRYQALVGLRKKF